MADYTNKNQTNNFEVISDKNGLEVRRTIAHLPSFYRTEANDKFLSSTLDPLIQKGKLKRLDGFIGRQDAYTRTNADRYLEASSTNRFAYQLEPTVTYTDKDSSSVNPEDRVQFTGTYDDLLNQLKYFNVPLNNHDRITKEKVYSWNPAVDLDKLINYREYYWLPEGPNPIAISSVGGNFETELDVTTITGDGSSVRAWVLGNKQEETNPRITLYKGNTYKFNVDACGHPFYLMTEPVYTGVASDGSTSILYNDGVSNNGADEGTVTITVPTDAPKVLYYQCGNHANMHGVILIKDPSTIANVDPANDIVGMKNYKTSNIAFTNGLKISFGNNVAPECYDTYANKEFYVEGVGANITLTDTDTLLTPESYATLSTIPYDENEYDSRPYAKAFYRPETKDYITIKRDSVDQNAWSRYNRWFHKSVIEATATANGDTADLDQSARALRPIIEFDSNLALYNSGKVSKKAVTLIDDVTTDAFSTIVNQEGYYVDGLQVRDGMRILFTADTDSLVKNKIFKLKVVTIAGQSRLSLQLEETSDSSPLEGEQIYVEFGTKYQGKTFHYTEKSGADSNTKAWIESQQKTKVNQQPVFDLYDAEGNSFSDISVYPSSTFVGSEIFKFAISSGSTTDTVLGLKVKYNTINNIGDITFSSDYNNGTFQYKPADDFITQKYSTGFLHKTKTLSTYDSRINWVERKSQSKQRTKRTYFATSREKKLFPIDVYKNSSSVDVQATVKVNGILKQHDVDYTLANGTTTKFIKFTDDLNVDDIVSADFYSSKEKVSSKGIYEIPDSLSNNPLNSTLTEFTYGQLALHLRNVIEKNSHITGDVPGVTNIRDYPDAYNTGGSIQQHSGSYPSAAFNLIDKNANFITAIDYVASEYQKFKENFITHSTNTPYSGDTSLQVDEIIKGISEDKNSTFPFYYEDMIGYGQEVSVRKYTVMDPLETGYAIDSQFSSSTLSNRAVYVYLNSVQLVLGTDYTFSTDDDSITILSTIAEGDAITIKDYSNTLGSFIPPTPAKLGLAPKFKPEIVLDNTYKTPVNVIVGHDGSRIKAYGDFRDDILLELEKRIYNNIKVVYDATLINSDDVIPSAFAQTDFTQEEINDVIGADFYKWAGRNNVDFRQNETYDDSGQFTWNYSNSKSLDDINLPGHWRGIFNYYYDTERPHTNPWEMLGYSEKPADWETRYGPAPYTSGNEILWDDLQRGYDYVKNTCSKRYIRPNLLSYIPVDENGNLKSPIASGIVAGFTRNGIDGFWQFGDGAPAETAWRNSSEYRFAVTKLLALLQPVKFFGTMLDPSRVKKNLANNIVSTETNIRQTLKDAKYHLETVIDSITGTTTRYQTAGYQPFIVNYLIQQNLDPATYYYDKMKNLEVQLGHKVAGFTDKANLKVVTDSTSPLSTSGSQFVPDENYKVLYRTSNPVQKFYYSGILIEVNASPSADGSTVLPGYRVMGYNSTEPYFTIYPPKLNANKGVLKTGKTTAIKYNDFNNVTQKIPYGTIFLTKQEVIDFIFGYEKYLLEQGFKFETWSPELEATLNWTTSATEFLYWTTQGWGAGSALVISPAATGFDLETKNSAIGNLKDSYGNYTAIDSGGRSIPVTSISTKRYNKGFAISIKGDVGLYGIQLHSVQKEHMLLFDNKTVFNDVIYDLSTGFRQKRMKLVGWKTDNWTGDFFAPGFIFDNATVDAWKSNKDYRIGDNVEYNAKFYVAKKNHTSDATFDYDQWTKKDKKPEAQLYPNFDYKISQFNDFYGLETNNFDASQESFAQHLTGYQSRDYLENLFVNDISQYKFYQGFIREKGTENAINKLAKATFLDEDINLSIYPEWMIKEGEFGNINADKNIQLKLPDTSVLTDPVSIEILDSTAETKEYVRSFDLQADDLYEKPLEYTASNTFDKYDYTKDGIDKNVVQKFKTAGYPRLDDVQHTAFRNSDIVNLDVNSLTRNDLIWVANTSSDDWDVLRIMSTGLKIQSVQSINSDSQLQFTFDKNHNFVINSGKPLFVMIVDSEYADLNQVYEVKTIPNISSIIVDYSGPKIGAIQQDADGSSVSTYGNVSEFKSVRFSSIDDVYETIQYNKFRDKDTVNNINGDRVFVDNDSSLWKVYEKQVPTTYSRVLSPSNTTANQNFGWQSVARKDGKFLISSAPEDAQGKIHFFFRKNANPGTAFGINRSFTMTANNDSTSKTGYSLAISSYDNWVFAGAPYFNTSADGSTLFSNQGAVQVFEWDSNRIQYKDHSLVYPPVAQDSSSRENLNFGWSLAASEASNASLQKYLFVGAPGHTNDTGIVYMYEWSVGSDGSTYDTWNQVTSIQSADDTPGQRFGHKVVTNANGDILAVSSISPGTAGRVEIFVRGGKTNDNSTSYTWTKVQTLTGVSIDGSSLNDQFGDNISMSNDGISLIISAPGKEIEDGSTQTFKDNAGIVYVYKWNADGSTLTYTQQQALQDPDVQSGANFGSSLHINSDGTRIVIGAEGRDNPRTMKFDSAETTFDLQDTQIVDTNKQSGVVYTATKYDTDFVIDQHLTNDNVTALDSFGKSVYITPDQVFVGSPTDDANVGSDGSTITVNDGAVSVYDSTVSGKYGWNELRTETPLIDDRKITSSFIFDRSSNKIIDYVEYYDPIKGRIFGVVDRELKYQTTWDPADYNYNSNGTMSDISWGEEHIGETWWDLSSVKWIWYEQGDQEYKSKHWGKLFPGSSVDIYEWVETTLLPSEWNQQADTASGLASRVSGTPYDINNNKFTVRQKYDSKKDQFVNYYYYWVRNSVFTPEHTTFERNNPTAILSNIIINPKLSGMKYFSVSDSSKLIVNNVKHTLQDDNIVLNIDYKDNVEEVSRHNVWKIFSEGDSAVKPDVKTERKWWDSLVGHDQEGNIVPDKNLPVNRRYGNNIRPRQSWYINRFKALKELIQYSNTILKQHQLVGSVSFKNLNNVDPEPTVSSLEYDGTTATYEDLTYINTADLSGNVNYLVSADETIGGLWALYQWSGTEWTRTKVQTYNTTNFWSYTDWYKTDDGMSHNENTVIDKQVSYEYELNALDLEIGKHVKVTNADTGGWKLFMKTATGWSNVGTQNGTIKLSEKLYDYNIDNTGYAGEDNFDENRFDQEPIQETRNILIALRDDIFIDELAKEYNTLFFIGLRYVLSEQNYVNWLAKSSFLNVTNSLRPLNQRKTYKTGKDEYVEKYINEVKPYHTKIREYKLAYTSNETLKNLNTDFDLPPFYDINTSKIRPPVPGSVNDTAKMLEYPYNIWNQYHTKYVKEITVVNGGSGYTTAPTVTFLGGTEEDAGPYTVLGRSTRDSTIGQYGHYYPLYTIKENANVADQQAGGSGTSTEYTFEEYSNRVFYMPDATQNNAVVQDPGTYKIFSLGIKTHATATATVSDGEVKKITVVTKGVGYTTTPQIVLTGGKTDGTTPSDTAKAYAVLDNDLVRDFNTTLKFDRISSLSSVVDWKINTTYEYGSLIRYANELYRANERVVSGSKFSSDGLTKLYGNESYITAADRIKGFYAPNSGMPGNELSQLMSGVDYGGTVVTGLSFDKEAGWDMSDWQNNSWDSYGTSRVRTFYGDNSTISFTFPSAPLATDVYTTYFDGVLQSSQVFHGDGSTTTFTLSVTPGSGVKIEFIPYDDDGVSTPLDDRTLDTLVSGGLFGSALGVSPDSVILEGDDFISPDTSYAPEEVVPGQLFDTLDIQVYQTPESGVPFITGKTYVGDGSTTTFDIGHTASTQDSVSVTVDGTTERLTTDYTVNIQNKTITFSSAPAFGKLITIKSFAVSGQNYVVLNQYTGDGSTASYTTSVRENFNADSSTSQLWITVDGVPTTAYTTSTTANTITVTFSSPPALNSSIQIAGFRQTTGRAYAEVRQSTITYDGSTVSYPLTYPIGTYGPYTGSVIMEINGKVLRGPDNTYYSGDGSTYNYGLVSGLSDGSTVDPAKTITTASQVEVYVNGEIKYLNVDYSVDIGSQTVVFVTAPLASDLIVISTKVDNHYSTTGTGAVVLNTSLIASDGHTLTTGTTLRVTTINNAMGMKQRREVLEGRSNGKHYLTFSPLNEDYVYVWLDGEPLVANNDFTINENELTIAGKTIVASNRLDVLYFAVESADRSLGYRIFKDMLNRTFYKRISKISTTELTQELSDSAKTITVKDGNVLTPADGSSGNPGVVFIDKERIEYFQRTGNVLSKLRRGTLGTGIKAHSSGASVVDAGIKQTVPYSETVYTDTHMGDGSTVSFSTTVAPSSANKLDIFIGGQRMLSTSEDGSTVNYTVDGSTKNVTFTTAPADKVQIKILQKQGQVWYSTGSSTASDGKGLNKSTTIQSKFITEDPTNAPK